MHMALPSWFRSAFRSRTTTYRDVELLFLSTFLTPQKRRNAVYLPAQTWEAVVGCDPQVLCDRFQEDGLIRLATLREVLIAQVSVQQFVEIRNWLGLGGAATLPQVIDGFLEQIDNKRDYLAQLSGEPFYCCSELGVTLASAFVSRSGVSATASQPGRVTEAFVHNIRAAAKWFLLAATGGVIGNRTDALFVHMQEAKAHHGAGSTGVAGSDSSHSSGDTTAHHGMGPDPKGPSGVPSASPKDASPLQPSPGPAKGVANPQPSPADLMALEKLAASKSAHQPSGHGMGHSGGAASGGGAHQIITDILSSLHHH
jgi:hypothetical protein